VKKSAFAGFEYSTLSGAFSEAIVCVLLTICALYKKPRRRWIVIELPFALGMYPDVGKLLIAVPSSPSRFPEAEKPAIPCRGKSSSAGKYLLANLARKIL
jgi:hypothetical protein